MIGACLPDVSSWPDAGVAVAQPPWKLSEGKPSIRAVSADLSAAEGRHTVDSEQRDGGR
jgi:hypothetical protein